MAEAALAQSSVDGEERVDHLVFGGDGQAARAGEGAEARVGLDGEVVGRQVRDAGAGELSGLGGGDLGRLARDAVEQIARNASEAGRERRAQRREPLPAGVQAAEKAQPPGFEGLHAHRDPVDARGGEGARPGLVERRGVRLEGDLEGGPAQRAFEGRKHASERLGGPERGGAAAEKDAVKAGLDRLAPEQGEPRAELALDRPAVALMVDGGRFGRVADEVAVWALLQAVREMNVDEQGQIAASHGPKRGAWGLAAPLGRGLAVARRVAGW